MLQHLHCKFSIFVIYHRCNQYVFPKIDIFPTVRGIEGYFDNNGESEAIQRYNDPTLLEDLGIPDLALLDFAQVVLHLFPLLTNHILPKFIRPVIDHSFQVNFPPQVFVKDLV